MRFRILNCRGREKAGRCLTAKGFDDGVAMIVLDADDVPEIRGCAKQGLRMGDGGIG
jgi:hypothetical protein